MSSLVPERPASTAKQAKTAHWLFSSVGGQGSRHLISALRTRRHVGDKPDNALWQSLPGAVGAGFTPDQGSFLERSGAAEMGSQHNLFDTFPRYIRWLRAKPERTAVFGLSAEFGLFSLFRVPHVAFLVRDPVDAYVSWAKPERHGDMIEAMGGLESAQAIDYYGTRWLRATLEYVQLRELDLAPHLIRYEQARTDAETIGYGWAFRDFRSDRTNRHVLSPSGEAQLRAKVEFVAGALGLADSA